MPKPLRIARPAKVLQARPIGAKLQVIAQLDPAWVHDLEKIVDWKLRHLSDAKQAS